MIPLFSINYQAPQSASIITRNWYSKQEIAIFFYTALAATIRYFLVEKKIETHLNTTSSLQKHHQTARLFFGTRLQQQTIHYLKTCMKHYPQSMETRIAIEKLHLFCRKWSQHLLNCEKLVNLTFSRKQWLSITKFPKNTAY